jgi:hypothetical protein
VSIDSSSVTLAVDVLNDLVIDPSSQPIWVSQEKPDVQPLPPLRSPANELALFVTQVAGQDHTPVWGAYEPDSGWGATATQIETLRRASAERFGMKLPVIRIATVGRLAGMFFNGNINRAMHAMNGNTDTELYDSEGNLTATWLDEQTEKRQLQFLESELDKAVGALDCWGRYFALLLLQRPEEAELPDGAEIPVETEELFGDVDITQIEPTRPSSLKRRVMTKSNFDKAMSEHKQKMKEVDPNIRKQEVAKQWGSVVSRLQAKIKTTADLARYVASRNPSRDFVRQVWQTANLRCVAGSDTLWIVRWLEGPKSTSDAEDAYELLSTKPFSRVVGATLFDDWFAATYGVDYQTAQTWREQQATLHNRFMHAMEGNGVDGYREVQARSLNVRMHALNGNTEWSDFEALPGLSKVIADCGNSGDTTTPLQRARQIAGMLSTQASQDSDVNYGSKISSMVVDAANNFSNYSIVHPEVGLLPRYLYTAVPNPPQQSTWQLDSIGVAAYPVNDVPLELTESVRRLIMERYKVRKDAVSQVGVRETDRLMFAGTTTPVSPSMLQPHLKMELYAKTLAWGADTPFVPLMNDCKIDPLAEWTGDDAIFGYNIGTVNNEDNLNALGERIFPWQGQRATGSITFHASMKTVPASKRATVLLAPITSLAFGDGLGTAINVALMAMAYAPYPCGFHVVGKPCQRLGVGNADDIEHIPFSNLVRIPGMLDIHMLLPSEDGVEPPTNQQEANTRVLYQATAGPSNGLTMVADQVLDVSWDPANLNTYELADFLQTWLETPASPVDFTSIRRWLIYFAEIHRQFDDARAALEWARVLTWRYPRPVNGEWDAGDQRFSTFGDNAASSTLDFGGRAFVTPGLFPEDAPVARWDYQVPGSAPMIWTKLAARIIQAYDRGDPSWYHDAGGPYELIWSQQTARAYAASWQMLYADMGLPISVWRNVQTDSNFVTIRNTLRMFFLQTANHPEGVPNHAPRGSLMAAVLKSVVGYHPYHDGFGFTLYHYYCWPSETWGEPVDLGNIGFGGDYSQCVPIVLPGVWMQITCAKIVKENVVLPVPNSKARGYDDQSLIAFKYGNNTMSAPVDASHGVRPAVGTQEWPKKSAMARWNERLTWFARVAMNARLTVVFVSYTDGAPVGLSDNGFNFYQRPGHDTLLQQAFTIIAGTDWNSFQNWIPKMDDDGRRIVVRTDGASRISPIYAGRSYAAFNTWALNAHSVQPVIFTGGEQDSDPYARWGKESDVKAEAMDTGGEILPADEAKD